MGRRHFLIFAASPQRLIPQKTLRTIEAVIRIALCTHRLLLTRAAQDQVRVNGRE
jgi:hypothetical protein